MPAGPRREAPPPQHRVGWRSAQSPPGTGALANPTPMTAAEPFAMPDDGHRHRPIAGLRHRKAPARTEHGGVGEEFAIPPESFGRGRGPSRDYAPDTGSFRSQDPDTVLAPHVAFSCRPTPAPFPEEGMPGGRSRPCGRGRLPVRHPAGGRRTGRPRPSRRGQARSGGLPGDTPAIAGHAPGQSVRLLGEGDGPDGGDGLPAPCSPSPTSFPHPASVASPIRCAPLSAPSARW